ncbi:LemA family protein [candidate division WWE3 bacterium]|nr:LemA family protein [candidate division WWE3 bacterium]
MNILLVSLGILVLIAAFLVSTYNSFVSLRNSVKESWSGIDVQLKRRAALIQNLVETVKGYASHEKEVFENVTRARSALMSAKTPSEAAQADNMLSAALKSLFAVAEAYPNLRASENFTQLQTELATTEDKIAYSRQFYNANVLSYNNKIALFPNSFLANVFGFKAEEFFKASEEERKDVSVKF